jgi:hypothetical protein
MKKMVAILALFGSTVFAAAQGQPAGSKPVNVMAQS